MSKLKYELQNPGAERIWYIGDAFRMGMSVEEVFSYTNVDRWYLVQLEELIKLENQVAEQGVSALTEDFTRALKRKGFSDARLAELTNVAESDIRDIRRGFGITPVYKRVDTCAAEFSTSTCLLYTSPSPRD